MPLGLCSPPLPGREGPVLASPALASHPHVWLVATFLESLSPLGAFSCFFISSVLWSPVSAQLFRCNLCDVFICRSLILSTDCFQVGSQVRFLEMQLYLGGEGTTQSTQCPLQTQTLMPIQCVKTPAPCPGTPQCLHLETSPKFLSSEKPPVSLPKLPALMTHTVEFIQGQNPHHL